MRAHVRKPPLKPCRRGGREPKYFKPDRRSILSRVSALLQRRIAEIILRRASASGIIGGGVINEKSAAGRAGLFVALAEAILSRRMADTPKKSKSRRGREIKENGMAHGYASCGAIVCHMSRLPSAARPALLARRVK